jgi:hypothetical protein
MDYVETRVMPSGQLSSSLVRFVVGVGGVEGERSRAGTLEDDREEESERDKKGGVISKTVEYEFHERIV